MRRSLPVGRLPAGWRGEVGLPAGEVEARRSRYGRNDIAERPPGRWRGVARDTVKDPMLWFLAGTSALYALAGQRAEASTLLAALVPLIGMDAFLHRRTQASTEGLERALAATATVLRDGGVPHRLPAIDLVPGDLALVAAGEAFPADGVIVAGERMQADESTLTGEAYPAAKRPFPGPAPDGADIAVDLEHWGLAGTRLLTGRAALRVVHTGGETLHGEIVRSAVGGAGGRTPLQAAIGLLVTVLVVVASVMCVIIAWARLRQGHGWLDAVVSAVTLAAAALPEEFPVVFAFFLGVGVYRLARRRALVRRAVSVENIGRVSCICSDKTGTLTEGRLRLSALVPAPGVAESRLLALAALASRADGGDPLDAAILAGAPGVSAAPPAQVLARVPFTEGRKRESAIVREPDGGIVAVVKGAVEAVAAMCERPDGGGDGRLAALAAEGHKVIACAWRALPAEPRGEVESGYRFAGLLAFEDPVRASVADAVARCRDAGIRTIMVTGDHPITAEAVARRIGLGGGAPRVVAGEEVEALAARGGAGLLAVDVIARAAPGQKLALVRGLQAAGEVVAVTGDGVNDVPALQAADVGIAMGGRGTRSAREVAAIVLLDDDFGTIVRAIGEGRQLFQNLRASFRYLLMIHIPLVVTAAFVPLGGYPLLYLPAHIVWLELVIHPTALLVFQQAAPGGRLLPAAPRGPARVFSRRDWVAIGVVGGLLTLLVAAGFLRSVTEGGDIEHGRAMALAVLTLASAGLTAALAGLRARVAAVVAAATAALTVALVQTPALAQRLHLGPLHLHDWALAAGAAALVALICHALVGRHRVSLWRMSFTA